MMTSCSAAAGSNGASRQQTKRQWRISSRRLEGLRLSAPAQFFEPLPGAPSRHPKQLRRPSYSRSSRTSQGDNAVVTVGMYYDVIPEKAALFKSKFQEVIDLLKNVPGHRESHLYQRVDDANS